MNKIATILRATGASHRAEEGASSVEYGLLVSGIAAVIVAAVFTFGGAVTDLFEDSCAKVDASVQSGAC